MLRCIRWLPLTSKDKHFNANDAPKKSTWHEIKFSLCFSCRCKKIYPAFKPAEHVSGVTFWTLKYTCLSYKMYPGIVQPNIYNANKSYTCGVQ